MKKRLTAFSPILFFLSILLLAFSFNFTLPVDPDLGWHLRYGEEVVTKGKILTVDTFSSTYRGLEYVNTSWLFDSVIHLIYSRWSFGGLTIFSAIVTSLAFIIPLVVFKSPIFLKITLCFVALYGSSSVLGVGIRSQSFSLVLFSLLVTLVFKYLRERKVVLITPIPLIFLVWANVHQSYFIGLLFMLIIWILELPQFFYAGESDNHVPQNTRFKWLVFLTISFLVSFGFSGIKPVGVGGVHGGNLSQSFSSLLLPLNFASELPTVGLIRTTIQEWMPPIFTDIPGTIVILCFIFSVASFIFRIRKFDDLRHLLLLLAFIYYATLSRRNITYYFMVFLPIFLIRMQDIQLNKKLLKLIPQINLLISVIIVVLSASVLIGKIQKNQEETASFEAYSESIKYPYSAVQFVKDYKPSGNMFNPYDWGGYLIWQLKEYPVFIDGRYPASKVFQEYETVNRLKEGWQDIFKKYDVRWMIIPSDSLFEEIVNIDGDWKKIYYDELASVLVKNEK